MPIEELIEKISKNKDIRIIKLPDEIAVSVKEEGFFSLILRIYPSVKNSEFLEIEDEWDELHDAVKEKYSKFPEILDLVKYLNNENYGITW